MSTEPLQPFPHFASFLTKKQWRKIYAHHYHLAHKEEDNARNRVNGKIYRETHREELLAHNRTYREAHREERLAYNRAYNVSHGEQKKAYRERNTEHRRAYYHATKEKRAPLRKAYDETRKKGAGHGLTKPQKQAIADAQNYCCAICGKYVEGLAKFHVDHDHTKGIVRGLLCQPCNHALGLFYEDTTVMQNAINYLKAGGIDFGVITNPHEVTPAILAGVLGVKAGQL